MLNTVYSSTVNNTHMTVKESPLPEGPQRQCVADADPPPPPSFSPPNFIWQSFSTDAIVKTDEVIT